MNNQRNIVKVKRISPGLQISTKKSSSRLKILKIREINHLDINDYNAGLMIVPQLMPFRINTARPKSSNQKTLREITLSSNRIQTGLIKLKALCSLKTFRESLKTSLN